MVSTRGRSAAATPTGLGRRIRDARVAKGLTQSDLAGAEYSVGFISRIESGARQPSRHTLTALANRLQVSLAYLSQGVEPSDELSLRHDVDTAELALAGGDIDEAMTGSAALLESGALRESLDLERRARLVHALAQEAAGDTHAAIIELEDLLEDMGPEPSAAVGIALSRCYRETGDYPKAVQIGEQVLGSLEEAGLAGTTEHIRLSMTVAGAHFESGALGVATRMARRAIKCAEANASPEAQAAAYWNASVFERAAGHLDRAVEFSRRALGLMEDGTSTRNLGKLRKQFALIQLWSPDADLAEVRDLLEHSGRELGWSSASPVDVARHTLARVRLALREGAPAEALTLLGEVPAGVCHQDPMLSTEVSVLRVVALVVMGEPSETAYSDAATLLGLMGSERGTAQLWFELGQAMEIVGDDSRATQAFREAALGLGAARALLPVGDRPAFRLSTDF